MRRMIGEMLRRVRSPLGRFHRDERGDALEYVLVLAAFVFPMTILFRVLRDILAEYFAMIAFYVGWPFL